MDGRVLPSVVELLICGVISVLSGMMLIEAVVIVPSTSIIRYYAEVSGLMSKLNDSLCRTCS
jgi:hypothetical protein